MGRRDEDRTENHMNRKAVKHLFALGLAAMVAFGAAGVASARTRLGDYVGVWQLESRDGGWGQSQGNGGWTNGGYDNGGWSNGGRDNGGWSNSRGGNGAYDNRGNNSAYDNRGNNGAYDNRGNGAYDNGGRNRSGYGRSRGWSNRQGGGYDSRGGMLGARLPDTFRIDGNRRELRLESMDGSLIRQIDSRRNRQLTSAQSMYGMSVYETYSLVNNGRELVIHTSIRGPQGNRELTTTYGRA